MAIQNYSVKVKGEGQLHEPVIKLEGIALNLWSTDGGETWTNKKVEVNVTGQLQVFMSCKARTGTSWEFVIKNITDATDKTTVVEEEGATGDDDIANYSEFSDAVDPK